MNYGLKDLGFYPKLSLNRWINSGVYKSNHLGLDAYGDTYHRASTDGIVTYAGNWGSAGYTIRIRYDDSNKRFSIFTQYKHGKANTFKVKVGDKVKKGQILQTIGNSGGNYGVHIHFDFVITPYQYNYQQSSSDRPKYSKNPLDYICKFDDQSRGSDDEKNPYEFNKVVGTSLIVKRDTSKNQIEVVGYALRCRAGAGTNQAVLGYIDFGIYDYTETKVSGDYTWYHVPSGWIAGTKEDTKVYIKEEPKQDTEEELKNTITELNNKISLLDKENKELKQVIEESKKVSYKEFMAPNTAYYYINLEKGQKVLY